MIRPLFLFIALIVPSVFALAAPPNVVVFLADDAGWGDYGFSGNHQVATPNIDSIAREGVSLDRFYVCPVCAPTRAEFLTGRYHPRGGVRGVSTGQERLDLSEKTVVEAFKARGYATGAFGKWHNGSQWPYHPMARGFDEYFGHSSGHWGEYFDAPLEANGQMIRTEGFIVDVCTDRALAFIDKQASHPFFCYIPFTTPHSPWAVPDEDWQRFKNKPLTQLATDPSKESLDETRCALAMIENQDRNVGRVLRRLEALGLKENTIVVYFSDNGPNTLRWTGGMRGKKGTTDEGGVRSVCYLRWPKRIPKGRVIEPIAGAIDLLPTLTSLAEVPRVGDKPLDGRDLSPLIFADGSPWPERRIFSTWAAKVSVRTDKYRLDDQGRLYDMRQDPGQTEPINEKEPKVARELMTAVSTWRDEVLKLREDSGNSKKKGKGSGPNSVDARPFPVGYAEFPITMLPARDGEPRGNVQRSSAAPNCSYFVNWRQLDDSMVWLIDVHESCQFAVSVDYTCPKTSIGAEIELQCGSGRLKSMISEAWDPPLYTNQDTLPRPHGESSMKEFRTMNMGTMKLEAGIAELTLKALKIPSDTIMDVRRVTLKRL